MNEHRATVQSVTQPGAAVHRAACDVCHWHGPWHASRQHASDDAANHTDTDTLEGTARWRVVCTDTPGAPRATYLTWQQVTERIDVP